jgi:hypothetical protein
MMKKRRAYIAAVVIVVVGLSLFAFKGKNPTVRQPQIGAPVHPVTKKFLLQKNIAQAKQTAERMDDSMRALIEASSMSFAQRWVKSVDLPKMENQFSQDLKNHVQAMTEIMKTRREYGSLKKLREFDFQNLLRKSDYLLSLDISIHRMKTLSPNIYHAYLSERASCAERTVMIGRL